MRRALILLIGLAPTGCLVDRPDADGDNPIPEPVRQALADNCAVQGCHDANTRVANLSLDLDDSAGIIGKATPNSALPLVEVGNVYGSYLALKLLGDEEDITGEPMPLGGTDNAGDIALIIAWIAGLEIPDQVPLPTFADDVLPILKDKCSGTGCHNDDGSPASSVWLLEGAATYDALVDIDYGSRKLVDPGNLRNSQLWQAVTGADGVAMPSGRPPLGGAQLQVIRDWILDGAQP